MIIRIRVCLWDNLRRDDRRINLALRIPSFLTIFLIAASVHVFLIFVEILLCLDIDFLRLLLLFISVFSLCALHFRRILAEYAVKLSDGLLSAIVCVVLLLLLVLLNQSIHVLRLKLISMIFSDVCIVECAP